MTIDTRPTRLSMAASIGLTSYDISHESEAASGCDEHPTEAEERAACAAAFPHFVRHWWFINRDSGTVQRFNTLWPGQQTVVRLMQEELWLILLKAGKLGFSELECAYDGWVALYRHANARIHIFSMDGTSAKSFLAIVRFGLVHLPAWLGLPIKTDEPGSDTTRSLKLDGGPDDTRSVWSYPANKDAAIDQVATHSHVDELARMPWPEDTMASVQSTVAPGGSIHVVSRGQGEGNHLTTLYRSAEAGGSAFHPHFEPFQSRPRQPVKPVPIGADPNEVWYEEQQASGMTQEQLNWFAPRTADDALKGSGEGAFIPESIWLGCYDPDLPGLQPGDRTPLVLSLDAGVSNDFFAAVAISRHPERYEDPAVREVMVWRPPRNGEIDYDEVENWVRMICRGGCLNQHPNGVGDRLSSGEMCSQHPHLRYQHRLEDRPAETCTADGVPCEACRDGNRMPGFNVVQIAYDAYQLVDMAQSLHRDRIAWCFKFQQGDKRMQADANLRLMAFQRRLSHRNDPTLNEHIANANAKTAAGEDNKLRIVKRSPSGKIDAAVATSMGVAQVLYLNMPKAGAA